MFKYLWIIFLAPIEIVWGYYSIKDLIMCRELGIPITGGENYTNIFVTVHSMIIGIIVIISFLTFLEG